MGAMTKAMTQVKFTIESDIVSMFKARCTTEGVSMASVISHWMKTGRPDKGGAKAKTDTRPHRRKTVLEMIMLLEAVLQEEEDYRDAIPEVFQSRIDSAETACEELAQAIECLEGAF